MCVKHCTRRKEKRQMHLYTNKLKVTIIMRQAKKEAKKIETKIDEMAAAGRSQMKVLGPVHVLGVPAAGPPPLGSNIGPPPPPLFPSDSVLAIRAAASLLTASRCAMTSSGSGGGGDGSFCPADSGADSPKADGGR